MATKISRVLLKVFGGSGASTNFGKFGSEAAGSGVKTKDLATIQALSAWDNGWQDAINSANKAPFLEDMNSAFLVHSTFLAYLLQEGIAEWNTDSYYFIGSIVKKTGTSEIYISKTDSNQGNALPAAIDDSKWRFLGDMRRLNVTRSLARAHASGAQSVSSASLGLLSLATEDFDIGGDFATNIFTAPVTGYYQVNAAVSYVAGVAGKRYMAIVYNIDTTTSLATGITQAAGTSQISACVSDIIYVVAGHKIRLAAYQDSGASADIGYSSEITFLSISLIREVLS